MTAKSSTTPTGVPSPLRSSVSSWFLRSSRVRAWLLDGAGAFAGVFVGALAGLLPESTEPDHDATETALRIDPRLTEPQKRSLLAGVPQLYRSGPSGIAADVAVI